MDIFHLNFLNIKRNIIFIVDNVNKKKFRKMKCFIDITNKIVTVFVVNVFKGFVKIC